MTDLGIFDDFADRLIGLIRSGNGLSDDEFGALALELHDCQRGTIGPLRSLAGAREQVNQWRELAAMPAAMFKELELTSLPPAQRDHVFHSSGTTTQASSRHYHNEDSLRLYEASLLWWFGRNVTRDEAMCFVSLTPPVSAAPNSSLVHMFERVGLESGGTVFLGQVDAGGAWAVEFNRLVELPSGIASGSKPVLLLGTAFSFVQVLDQMKAERIELALPEGSRVMETGGYKGRSRVVPKAELHLLIRSCFGVAGHEIQCEYGMSELSSQAYDTGRGRDAEGEEMRLFRFPPWARALVISPESGKEVADGEIGLLRIFDLANVYSVMAIQTEDLAIRWGDEFELIGREPMSEARGCSLMSVAD